MTVAALGDPPAPGSVPNAFLANRVFGVGEQHVYLIERHQTVVVRFRSSDGSVVNKTVSRDDRQSVAFTVEGYGEGGAVELAVAADATPNALQPSPSIRSDGTIAAAGPLALIAPAALVLGGASPPPLDDGAKWNTNDPLPLPLGAAFLRLVNAATVWEGDSGVLQIAATGTFDTHGSIDVAGFGVAALRGGGSVTGVSFVDTRERLLLGSTYALHSSGNAVNRRGDSGTYMMKAAYTIKLAHYVAGLMPPPPMAPSGVPGLIETAPPDNIMHGGPTDELSHPAATDNIFTSSPLPSQSPEPVPDVSLPPVPLPVSSDAPLASPPMRPPTPYPTRTPR